MSDRPDGGRPGGRSGRPGRRRGDAVGITTYGLMEEIHFVENDPISLDFSRSFYYNRLYYPIQ
jgi:hypothetical protein